MSLFRGSWRRSSSVFSLIARYRNGEGIVRQQVKVLMWVGAVAVIFFGVTSRLQGGPIWLDPLLNIVFSLFVGGAVTLAILRHRLFEIDRLTSRTVTYAVLAGTLALVYGFGVWLPSRIVGEQTPLFVADPPWRLPRCSTRSDAGS